MTEEFKDDAVTAEAAKDAPVTKLRASTTNTDDKAIRRTRTIATVILIILIILILSACLMMYALLRPGGLQVDGRLHAGITWIRSIYGHGVDLQGQINPTSVTFAPDGNSVWITDTTRLRLVQYDLNGRLLQIINANWEVNEMIAPTRIAISPQGWHYVAEQTYHRVHIFDENWVHQDMIMIERPTSIAANDEILLIGGQRGFAAFTYRGEPIGMHAADAEDEINRFDHVRSLAIDENNNYFVLDAFNNRFVKYDVDGVPIYEVLLGHPGNQGIEGARHMDAEELAQQFPANLQLPQGITLDGNGRVYIIDMFTFSVAVFDAATGDFIKRVGQYGTEDGRFFNPNCIAYNPRTDTFASAEATLGRVQLFSIDGSSADPVAQARRQLGDFLSACCIPLIIILIILAAYVISRFLARKRREKEMTAALEGSADSNSEGVVDAVEPDSADVQQT